MLSTTSKYALTAMLALARAPSDEYVMIRELSSRIGVPAPYLSKIINTLAAKGFVETKKGISGGVRLQKNSSPSFLDICRALDDPIVSTACFLSKTACNREAPCPIHDQWLPIRENTINFLRQTPIGSIPGSLILNSKSSSTIAIPNLKKAGGDPTKQKAKARKNG
jgi:Rrf2 family iron-sulfur cluster assembly transcriptional regulator